MLSGSTYFPDTMGSASTKGRDADIELGLGGAERRYSKFTLLPAANPPRQDLYHFAPIFKVFRVSSIPAARVQRLKPCSSERLLRLFGSQGHPERERVGRRRPQIESNIPLEISLYLSGWVSAVIKYVRRSSSLAARRSHADSSCFTAAGLFQLPTSPSFLVHSTPFKTGEST